MKAHLINKYVYTIDSVLRLHDAEVYKAKLERKHIADSTKNYNDSTMLARWLDAKLKKK